MNIEAKLRDPRGNEYIQEAVQLLGESSCELLGSCADALDAIVAWLERNNSDRFSSLRMMGSGFGMRRSGGKGGGEDVEMTATSSNSNEKKEKVKESEEKSVIDILEAQAALKEVLERFKDHDRYVSFSSRHGSQTETNQPYLAWKFYDNTSRKIIKCCPIPLRIDISSKVSFTISISLNFPKVS